MGKIKIKQVNQNQGKRKESIEEEKMTVIMMMMEM